MVEKWTRIFANLSWVSLKVSADHIKSWLQMTTFTKHLSSSFLFWKIDSGANPAGIQGIQTRVVETRRRCSTSCATTTTTFIQFYPFQFFHGPTWARRFRHQFAENPQDLLAQVSQVPDDGWYRISSARGKTWCQRVAMVMIKKPLVAKLLLLE